MATVQTNATSPASAFEIALEEFKKDPKISRRIQENFKDVTLDELKRSIAQIQAKQQSQRRLQNLKRLEPFIEAMEQFGKVVEVFCNVHEIVAFVWGPTKFLLQIASSMGEAFNELLAVYEEIGENLPLLSQYEELFRNKSHMLQILTLMYKDILNFHRLAVHYFSKPVWKQIFDATWKTQKTRFSGIIANLSRHRQLIENQATLLEIKAAQESRETEERRFKIQRQNEDLNRRQVVHKWLVGTRSAEEEQDRLFETRANYPGTGDWLLQHTTFQDWFDPQYPTIPPLLWLTGDPGSGKTTLASVVVDAVTNLKPQPTVLFFYFKSGDPDRKDFLAAARSLLSQFLQQDNSLLDFLYGKCCNSGEAFLTSRKLILELLAFAFENSNSVYIILDGLDEFDSKDRDERKIVTQWFRQLVEDLPPSNPDRLRCLFVSQDDGPARRDFSGLAKIRIDAADIRDDLVGFSLVEAEKVKAKFQLTDQRTDEIVNSVVDSVGGLFLLAKLVWTNLLGQSSIVNLERELEPGVFPSGINEAYTRILNRILQKSVPAERDDALQLMGWLLCAKRPLKWNEIQALKSINLDNRTVELERQGFRVDIKDLCESLVDKYSDGTVDFVHLTAKIFLVREGHIDPALEELRMAALCIDYLNLPSFLKSVDDAMVRNGDFGFMDYAVLNWIRHLEVGAAHAHNQDEFISQITESLEIFLDEHWNSPSVKFQVSQRTTDRLQFFINSPNYNKLEQAMASMRKQLTYFAQMREGEIALDLSDVVGKVRKALEKVVQDSSGADPSLYDKLTQIYGIKLFKCFRLSCQYFTKGFDSAEDRDKHVSQHIRPFRCKDEHCLGYTFGFAREREYMKHMMSMHPSTNQDRKFPTDLDVEQSLASGPVIVTQAEVEKIQETSGAQEADPVIRDVEPEPVPVHMRGMKLQRQTEFKCNHCGKVFGKRYNLQSHSAIHRAGKEYKCVTCGMGFARPSDLKRHSKKHTGEAVVSCSGCGRTFARADVLRAHHKSETGKACVPPLQPPGQDTQQQTSTQMLIEHF